MPGDARRATATAEVETGDWAFHVPSGGGDDGAKVLRRALQIAVLAPSNHNTQPWRFRLADDAIDLVADRSRRLAAVDPDDRELVISCGSVLHHLVLALRRLGTDGHVTLLPDPADGDRIARVELRGPCTPTADELGLFDQITRRHTSRHRFTSRPVPQRLLGDLGRDAAGAGCWLHVVGPAERPALEHLLAAGLEAQARDEAFQLELASWVDRSRARSFDGMVPGVHGAPPKEGGAGEDGLRYWRTFADAAGAAAGPGALLDNSPALVVLGTGGDDQAGWLRCGMALSTILLRARQAGVWASFLNQPVEVPELRQDLAGTIDAPGAPQLLLRLGFGPDPGPTPRRPLDDVLLAT